MPTLTIKNYNKKYWPNLRRFTRKHFWQNYILLNKKFFIWQYGNNPHNPYRSVSVKMMVLGRKILGHLGVVSMRMRVIGGASIGSGFLCNLLTAESCRGFGLGSYLIQEVCKDFPLLITTGYASKTGPMYEKLGGWKSMGNLNRYIKLINLADVALLIGRKRVPFLKVSRPMTQVNLNEGRRIVIEKKKHFDKEINVFIKKTLSKYPITVSRDSAYLNWRYADHPYFKYKILLARNGNSIVGYIVFRIAKSSGGKKDFLVGHILDLMAENEAVGPLLIEAERQMTVAGVCLIDYFSTGLFHRDDFIKLGFRRNDRFPFNVVPLHFNPIASTKNGDNNINFLVYYGGKMEYKNELCNVNNWYITKGDGDKDRPNPH